MKLNEMTNPTFGEAALIALLGFIFVFVVLLLLMFILKISAAIFTSAAKKNEVKKAAEAPKAAPAETKVEKPLAKGSCGDLKLNNVPERTAAMVMAVVADEMKTPLNQLRFKSIKKVGSEDVK